MYDIKEVTQVNTSYIFFHFSDGTQDRKTIDMRELKHLYNDVCKNIKHYDFMKEECEKVRESLKLESEKLENIIQGYEKYIAEHQDVPNIRRGLDNVCYSLETTIKNKRELNMEISGVNKTWSYAMEKYWKLYKLQKQIESVLKVK